MNYLEWKICYEKCRDYYILHHDLLIPDKFLQDWLNQQRELFHNGKLEYAKVVSLNAIDFIFGTKEVMWQLYYKKASKYYEENGHLLMPIHNVIDGLDVSKWLDDQRAEYPKINDKRKRLLDKIKMIWSTREYKWQRNYFLAKKYYEENGHLHIPYTYTVWEVELGVWIKGLRNRKNSLSQEQIELLDAIKMDWTLKIKNKITWEDAFNIAKSYFEEYGNLKVPKDTEYKGFNLGVWIKNQRYNKSKLTEEQINKLDSIGMIWEVYGKNDVTWEDAYTIACHYYEKYGNLEVPTWMVFEDFELGEWLGKQRSYYQTGTLKESKKILLDKIEMIWDLKKHIWMKSYGYLKKYYELYGNTLVPRNYVIDGIDVYVFARNQRERYKNGTLSAEQIKLLNDIKMVWDIKFYKFLNNKSTTKNAMLKRRQQLEMVLDELLGTFDVDYQFNSQEDVEKIATSLNNRLTLEKSNKNIA